MKTVDEILSIIQGFIEEINETEESSNIFYSEISKII